jgi:hypothetical protein
VRLAAAVARSVKADLDAEFRAVSRAVTSGVKDAGDGLKDGLRKQVVSAGLGGRLARTWRGRAYPNKGYDAASLVWSKAPQILRAFDEGIVVRGRDGLWLAIPTENAPKKGVGGKRINPSNFPEQALGGFADSYYSHRVEIEVYVSEGDPTVRDAAFDALLQEIGIVLEADPTLGGLAFGMTYGRPEPTIEPVSGAPAFKTGVIELEIDYEAPSPLG